jgi:hypothetical protein
MDKKKTNGKKEKKKEKKKIKKLLKIDNKTETKLPKITLSACIMIKNESARIHVTLESIKGVCDKVIVYDTGSTDDSQNLVKKWCEDNKIQLHMIEGVFVDFSVSRNKLLEFADDKSDYLLLLDSNEELKDGKNLRNFVDTYNGRVIGWHCLQRWLTANSYDQYYNIKLIKTKHNFRYFQSVHEYIESEEAKKDQSLLDRMNIFWLFQDRKFDDDKSKHRFVRDREMLYKEYLQDPNNGRVVFYLSQTFMCLGQYHISYRYYKKRTIIEGFPEEIYHSYYHMARISQALNHDWSESLVLYLKAFEHTKRVEPLLRISEYYIKLGELNEQKIKQQLITENVGKDSKTPIQVNYVGCSYYDLAYHYTKMATILDYPERCILFVNRQTYDYERWFLLSQIILKDNNFTIFVNNNMLDKKGSIFENIVKKYKEGLDITKLCIFVGEKESFQTTPEKHKLCIDNLKLYNEMLEKMK